MTRGIFFAAGAVLGIALGPIAATADPTTPPPPTSWMQKACPTDDHGVVPSGETDCFWTPPAGSDLSALYLVRTRVRGIDGTYRPHAEARCVFYVQPRLEQLAGGCSIKRKAHPTP